MAVFSRLGSNLASRSMSPRLRADISFTNGYKTFSETHCSRLLEREVMYTSDAIWIANWIKTESRT
jgi:hypothetical protein